MNVVGCNHSTAVEWPAAAMVAATGMKEHHAAGRRLGESACPNYNALERR